MNNNVSLANKRWEIPEPLLDTCNSSRSPLATSYCKSLDKPSAMNRKRYGDNGSPWWRPRVGQNGSKFTLLKWIEYRMVETHSIIHHIHLQWKPSRPRTPSKKPQSMRSYALVKSNLYAPIPLLSLPPCLIACKHSKAIKSALSWCNKIIQQRPKLVHQAFGYNLVNLIAKWNWRIVL
jgi:hypothetical protein